MICRGGFAVVSRARLAPGILWEMLTTRATLARVRLAAAYSDPAEQPHCGRAPPRARTRPSRRSRRTGGAGLRLFRLSGEFSRRRPSNARM